MKRLPASQLEIMQTIWQFGKPITRKELHKLLEEKDWKITTLNTLLNRLAQSEFLEIRNQGKEYIYTPMILEKKYLEFESKYVLSSLFGSSVKNFFASICNSEDISDSEIVELEELLQTLKERGHND